MKKTDVFKAALFTGLAFGATPVLGMQPLNDRALSAVNARDGIVISVEATQGWSADSMRIELDADGPQNGDFRAEMGFNNVLLHGVHADGAVENASPASAQLSVDVGSDGSDALLKLGLETTSRVRARSDSLTIPSQPGVDGRSFGTMAFDFDGGIELVNRGVFDASYDKAYLKGWIDNANLFYRQGDDTNAWVAMHDLDLLWEIPEGTLGITQEGIVHRAGDPQNPGVAPLSTSDTINLAMDFDLIFGRKVGDEEFRVTQDARGIMHFGWLGSIKDAEIKWMPGGIWYGQTDDVFDPNGAGAWTSEGLRFSSQWDYVSRAQAVALGDVGKEFRWRLGEVADVASNDRSNIQFELGDWTIWGSRSASKPAAHYFPLIALDVINGAGEGPGGLCWGSAQNTAVNVCQGGGHQFVNLRPGFTGGTYGSAVQNAGDAGALAIIVRDGQLQSYSRTVRLLEWDAAGVRSEREFGWGLIYALANLDANIYLYPGGSGTAGNVDNGIIADIMVMSQTLDGSQQGFNWDHGTHLLIADTDAEMGIGFVSGSFLLAANDTRMWVRNQTGSDYYSGDLDFFSPTARFNYTSTFGGGLLPGHPDYDPLNPDPARPQTVRGALLDLNLEGLVNLRFSPSDPDSTAGRNYLGYSGALRLGSNGSGECAGGSDCGLATNGSADDRSYGSYISIAEPNRPEVALRLANITGDISFTNGRVDLVGTGERGTGSAGNEEGTDPSRPKMVISNDIQIGQAAHSRLLDGVADTQVNIVQAQELMIDRIMLGDATLGRMIIPSARIHSSITLEPQLP